MPQHCPLGFRIPVNCKLDCAHFNRYTGECCGGLIPLSMDEVQYGVSASISPLAEVPRRDSYQQVKAELNHLSNKLNENLDKRKQNASSEF